MFAWKSGFRLRFASLVFAACALAGPVLAAEPDVPVNKSALTPQSQAEWQGLLTSQVSKTAVSFTNTTIPHEPLTSFGRLFAWNEIALDTTAIDHTPPAAGQTYVFGQQFGPPRSARAMAIVHIAMFEAVNAVFHEFKSYTGLAPVDGETPVDLAIAQSAHDALVFLYPSQQSRLDALLAFDEQFIRPNAASKALGQAAAASIIALRSNDGSQTTEPVVGVNFFPQVGPGFWSPDPISQSTTALGANWSQVKPFVIQNATQFLPVPPPSLASQEWVDAFNQEKALGGDPAHGTPTKRTPAETFQGIFWTYDGTPNICAPPRLYNQIARQLVFQRGTPSSVSGAARLLALLNTSMADAGLTAWTAKWFYQFWRPVTAIRNTDLPAGSPLTPDPTFYPLGGQATNQHGPNFTPPFPAYPSGHATFGGAVFEVMRDFFRDRQAFTIVSDEFDGQNFSDTGVLMPLIPQTFTSLTDAEFQNAESRIWIGVHWQFDADKGVQAGNQVADFIIANAFQPVK
jgi:membrane-associated phospholipid phosphatase